MTGLKFGVVSDVKPGFARVDFAEDQIVTGFLPVMVRKTLSDKDSWELEVNEHVACLMDEECEKGVILGAIYSSADQPSSIEGAGIFAMVFGDGTKIIYNKNTHELKADVIGSAKVTATTTIEADATTMITLSAPIINLSGNVFVNGVVAAAGITASGVGAGGITASGNISTTGDIVAGTKSLKLHVHSGVTTGPGTSGPPL